MSTINGTNNGDGTWAAQLPETDPGTYDVIVTATKDGETATASATLTVTASAATVTIDALTTANVSPALSGAVDDGTATVVVSVDGQDYPATNNGDGTWTLAGGQIDDLAVGSYTLTVTATNASGDSTATATLDVQAASTLSVTVDVIETTDASPAVTGTVNDPDATLTLTIDGADYPAAQDGQGGWTVAAGTITALDPGNYDATIVAEAADGATDSATATVTITDSVSSTPAVHFDGNTLLESGAPLSLGGLGSLWAVGAMVKYDVYQPASNQAILSTTNAGYDNLVLYNYENSDNLHTFLKSGQTSNNVNVAFDKHAQWFLWVVTRNEVTSKPRILLCPVGDAQLLNLIDTGIDFDSSINPTTWILGGTELPKAGNFEGAMAHAFVFEGTGLSPEDAVAIASGTPIENFGTPKHHWLTGEDYATDQGSAGVDLTFRAGSSVSMVEGPDYSAPVTGGGGTGGDGGNSSDADTANITPISEATLVDGAAGDPVTVSATETRTTQDSEGNDVVETIEWPITSVDPGKIKRIVDASGNYSWLTVNHIPEGGVTVGNDICDSQDDVVLSNLYVEAPDGTVLFDGPLTIYPRTHTRPWWYIEQVANPDADLSVLPYYPSDATVSKAQDYDSRTGQLDPNGNDLNGPMGSGLSRLDTGGTGPHAGIGPLPSWDVPYLANPNSENARVMRGMADAFANYPIHLRDPETLKLVSITKWPSASAYHRSGHSQNPLKYSQGSSPYSLTQQEVAHMPGYMIAATLVYGTSYDREELAIGANYVGLIQNPGYRKEEKGELWQGLVQTRSRAWGIRNVAAAAKFGPDEWKGYFQGWMDFTRSQVLSEYSINDCPIDKDSITWQSNDTHYRHASVFMNEYLVTGLGMTVAFGHADWQDVFDIFGRFPVQAMLDAPHEVATTYHIMGWDQNHDIPADWDGLVQLSIDDGTGNIGDARLPANFRDLAEDSMAMQDALNSGLQNPVAGDFMGNPTSSDNTVAYLRAGLAMATRLGIDRSQEAWDKYLQYERIGWGDRMHYRVIPAPEST